ncbi:hypothetical protein LEP1GSC047_1326 [Leptospira inadai serovar Lyme str. 10]|uniref:Uncharacterized protein n=2 Tax=Leptospira inadai serovar Lyme TaxID=293084 RepID=V6H8F9_9LEPT|nr:hypothetical protein [Leptospira inadai]EQA35196.1 hypothetical protein LEP1GSC047_1326 [Leptospira inadai serovar Lyme str. 10]PNV76049.1 hypothetical protein BES34_005990 [Leptospira inadai serovar Lyme]
MIRISLYLCRHTIPFFFLLIVLGGSPNANESGKNTRNAGNKYKIAPKKAQSSVRNEYILTLRKGTGSERVKELLPDFKIIRMEKIGESMFHVVFESDPGIELLKSAGKKSGFVESVEPNQIFKAF